MQHLPLFPRPVATNAFPEKALKLQPLYKLKPTDVQPLPSAAEAQREFSSPVCYAHLKNLREGFEE